MGLFTRGQNAESKEVKQSGELCQRRDALGATWPQVKAAWDKIDEAEVMPAAAALSVALLTANHDRILEAREKLKRSIWDRDGIKQKFQREMDELSAEIETLSGPVVFARAAEWQAELSGLRGRKIVESVERFADMSRSHTPQMVKYRSNFKTVNEAKETLVAAIRQLREMRQKPLGEVHAFIATTEEKLKKLDFSTLQAAAAPVTETSYAQLIQGPDVEVVAPGGGRYRVTPGERLAARHA